MMLSSVFACLGQLLWKMSIRQGIIVMAAGFALYGIGALVMLLAYRFGKLSILQPILSLNYVLSIILAVLVLKEEITIAKCVGVIIIVVGVVFIAGGDRD